MLEIGLQGSEVPQPSPILSLYLSLVGINLYEVLIRLLLLVCLGLLQQFRVEKMRLEVLLLAQSRQFITKDFPWMRGNDLLLSTLRYTKGQ